MTSTSRSNPFVEARRPSARLACGLVLLGVAVSCRAVHLCQDGSCEDASAGGSPHAESAAGADNGGKTGVAGGEDQPRAGQTGGGEPSAAGQSTGGEGGATPTSDCDYPQAECDESRFTRCETNLQTDLAHCGACSQYCHGVCAEGKCHELEVLSFDGPIPADAGIAVLTNYAQPELYALGNDLLRWSEKQGVTTVVKDAGSFKTLLAGSDRLFAITDVFGVWSVPFAGGELTSTGRSARAAMFIGSNWYAVDASGVPYCIFGGATSEAAGSREELPLPLHVDEEGEYFWTEGADGQPILLVTALDENDAGYEWRAFQLYKDEEHLRWRQLTYGSGRPRRVRSADSLGVFVDVQLNTEIFNPFDPQAQHDIIQIDADGTERNLGTLAGVISFEVAWNSLYVSRRVPDPSGRASVLSLISLTSPKQPYDYASESGLASLTYFNPYFYAGAVGPRVGLVRFRSWLAGED